MKIKVFWRIILICIGVLIIYGGLQQLQPKSIEFKAISSFFIERGIFVPIATAAMFLTFIVISYMYQRIQKGLHYKKTVSGIIFSISFIGFWIIGMFEPYLIFNESIYFCLFLAIIDSIALGLLGLLLGIFTHDDRNGNLNTSPNYSFIRVLVVAAFYAIGRYASYSVLGINSSFDTLLIPNLIWIFGIGFATGFLYKISYNANQYPPLRKAFWFGFTYFGLIWILYNSFNPLFVKHTITGIGNVS